MALLDSLFGWLQPDIEEEVLPRPPGSEFQMHDPGHLQFLYGEFTRVEPQIVRSFTTQLNSDIPNNILVLQCMWSVGEIDSITNLYYDDIDANSESFGYNEVLLEGSTYMGGRKTHYLHVLDGADKTVQIGGTSYVFKGHGHAYSIVTLAYDAELMPNKPTITASGYGRKILTFAGSLVGYSNNIAEVAYDFLTSDYGCRIPTEMLNYQTFVDEQQWSAVMETNSDAVTQPRMAFNGVLKGDLKAAEAFNQIRKAYRIFFPYVGGKYRFIIERERTAENYTVDSSNMLSDLKIQEEDSNDLLSAVVIRYMDKETGAETKIRYPDPSTDDNVKTYTLVGINNAYEAKQAAYVIYSRSNNAVTASVTVDNTGQTNSVGEVIKVTEPKLGMTDKLFIITGKTSSDHSFTYKLLEYVESIYPWVAHPIPTLPLLNVPDNRTVAAPTAITHTINNKGNLIISWTSALSDFSVQLKTDTLEDLGTTGNKFMQMPALDAGSYYALVRAENGIGYYSEWVKYNFTTTVKTGPTKGATIGDDLSGQFDGLGGDNDATNFFTPGSIKRTIIDVDDLFAETAYISGTLEAGTTTSNDSILIINNGLRINKDDGTAAFITKTGGGATYSGKFASGIIDSIDIFTKEVKDLLINDVGSGGTGGIYEYSGLPYSLPTTTNATPDLSVTISNGNDKDVTLSVNIKDNNNADNASNPNWAKPVYQVVFKRGTTTISTQTVEGSAFNYQEPDGSTYHSSFAIDETVTYIDNGHAMTGGGSQAYNVVINRVSGESNAPKLTAYSVSQQVVGGGGSSGGNADYATTAGTADNALLFNGAADTAFVKSAANNTFSGDNTFSGNNTFTAIQNFSNGLQKAGKDVATLGDTQTWTATQNFDFATFNLSDFKDLNLKDSARTHIRFQNAAGTSQGYIYKDPDVAGINVSATHLNALNGLQKSSINVLNETESDAKYLGISAKAADSEKLDNLDSTQFLRSDVADTATGLMTFSAGSNNYIGANPNVDTYRDYFYTAYVSNVDAGTSMSWGAIANFNAGSSTRGFQMMAAYSSSETFQVRRRSDNTNSENGSGLQNWKTLALLEKAQTFSATQTFASTVNITPNGDLIQDGAGNRILHNGGYVVLGNLTKHLRIDGASVLMQDASGSYTIAATDKAQTFTASQNFTGGITRNGTDILAKGDYGVGGSGLTVTDANSPQISGFYSAPGGTGQNYPGSMKYWNYISVERASNNNNHSTFHFGESEAWVRATGDNGATWTENEVAFVDKAQAFSARQIIDRTGNPTIGNPNTITNSHLSIGADASGMHFDRNEVVVTGSHYYLGTGTDHDIILRQNNNHVIRVTPTTTSHYRNSNFTGGLQKNGTDVISLGDLTYNSDETLALIQATVDQFESEKAAGVYDNFATAEASAAFGFVNAITTATNLLIAQSGNVKKLKSSSIEVSGAGYALNQNPTFQDSLDGWSFGGNNGESVESTTGESAIMAAHMMKLDAIGINRSFFSNQMPCNPEETYVVSLWARQTGAGGCYIAVDFLNSSGVSISGSGGDAANWPSKGSYHYTNLVDQPAPTAWTKFEFQFGKNAKMSIPTGAVSMRIGMLHNWDIDDQILYIQDYRIEKAMGAVSIKDGAVTAEKVTVTDLEAFGATIGGWGIDNTYIWTGTKKTSDGFTTSGTTFNNNGAIRSKNFYIANDGSAYFKGDITGASGTFSGTVKIGTTELNANNTLNSNTSKADVGLANVDNKSSTDILSDAATDANTAAKTDGTVGGWTIDSTAIYSGAKDTSGYTSSGITLNSAGSIHAREFYIDTAGNAKFAGELEAASGSFAGSLSAATGTFEGTVYAQNITGDANEFGEGDLGNQAITGTTVWNNLAQVKVPADANLARELTVEPFLVEDGSGCSFELRVQTQPIQSGGTAVDTKVFYSRSSATGANDVFTDMVGINIPANNNDYWVIVRALNNVGSFNPVATGKIRFNTRIVKGTLAVDIL